MSKPQGTELNYQQLHDALAFDLDDRGLLGDSDYLHSVAASAVAVVRAELTKHAMDQLRLGYAQIARHILSLADGLASPDNAEAGEPEREPMPDYIREAIAQEHRMSGLS